MTIVLQEILQDKIYLDATQEVRVTGDVDDVLNLADLEPDDL
jgi:hypothetical protein